MKSAFARGCLAASLGFALLALDANARMAMAGAPPMTCAPVAPAHDAVLAQPGGRWVQLSDTQRAFVVGIYALNPNTPAGLPVGDRAILATVGESPEGEVFFVDGDMTCSPMALPPPLIQMLMQIGTGDIAHAGPPT